MFELVEPGSSRIRIRLVKVMNLETLRHNCLTPPAAAELVVVVVVVAFLVGGLFLNCRLVSINFPTDCEMWKMLCYDNYQRFV